MDGLLTAVTEHLIAAIDDGLPAFRHAHDDAHWVVTIVGMLGLRDPCSLAALALMLNDGFTRHDDLLYTAAPEDGTWHHFFSGCVFQYR